MSHKKINTDEYKLRLRDYIHYKNLEIDTRANPPKIRCPFPGHEDKKPSAIVYEDSVYCPICCKTLDIFNLAGLLVSSESFPEQIKEVQDVLGETPYKPENTYKPEKTKKSSYNKNLLKPEDLIGLIDEKSSEVYSDERLQDLANWTKENFKNDWGVFKEKWFYYDEKGLVVLCDARYELEDKDSDTGEIEIKKTITSLTYNGRSATSKGAPVVLYNRHLIAKEKKPILIVEGAKTARAASVLKDFTVTTWNRGGKNCHNADWSILKGKEIYIFPDDDGPGIKTAIDIHEILKEKYQTKSKIIDPIKELRKLKPQGADIVEALLVYTPEKLTNWIRDCKDISIVDSVTSEKSEATPGQKGRVIPSNPSGSGYPFRMLGVADDGKAYFIDRSDRLQKYNLSTLSKSQLLMLAPRNWWIFESAFGNKEGRTYWDSAIDFIIEVSNSIDFDPDRIRGRGAWRDNGNLVYHDGRKSYGKTDPKKIYLRKNQEDIGICEKHLKYSTRKEMRDITCELSFETKADAIRTLGWSALAPFGGCLTWRPAILVTGPSGSGKTTVANHIIRRITKSVWLDGSESTPAGVRGTVQNDTCSVVFEEAECDTPKKRENRTNLLSLMRTNTSDDAPDAAKGTADGGARTYKMRNMFCFIAISPEIESVADENRVFRIYLKKPKGSQWSDIQTRINAVMTEGNCRKLRAFIWSRLEKIMKDVDIIVPILQDIIKKDFRYCYAEALLLSAYFSIWTDKVVSRENIKESLDSFYEMQTLSDSRDETEEITDRLFDETVPVNGYNDKRTIREILQSIYTKKEVVSGYEGDEQENELQHKDILHLKQVAHRYGLDVNYKGEISIANNHHEIMKIIGKGNGYNIQLARHKDCVDKGRVVMIAGKSRRCVVIDNIFEIDKEVDANNEKINI